MIRQIIKIDEDKCNGCGLCVSACHEGAIGLEEGKAKLLREDYCDGLGNCLPVCEAGAISFEEREAPAFDEKAVQANFIDNEDNSMPGALACGCPGTNSKTFERDAETTAVPSAHRQEAGHEDTHNAPTCLNQWPVQIKLVPVNAPYFDGTNLLIAADCSAYAYGNFHKEYMKNRITIIGCPKLDDVDYSAKLTEILKQNDIKSVTAVRMEVPCCGGIENAAITALRDCGKMIPWQVVTISTDGKIPE